MWSTVCLCVCKEEKERVRLRVCVGGSCLIVVGQPVIGREPSASVLKTKHDIWCLLLSYLYQNISMTTKLRVVSHWSNTSLSVCTFVLFIRVWLNVRFRVYWTCMCKASSLVFSWALKLQCFIESYFKTLCSLSQSLWKSYLKSTGYSFHTPKTNWEVFLHQTTSGTSKIWRQIKQTYVANASPFR